MVKCWKVTMQNGAPFLWRVALLSVGLVLAPVATPDVRAAEGRFCGDLVESGIAAGATKEEAMEKARQWWTSRAGTLGRGYEHWENAADTDVVCKGGDNGDGQMHCKAIGRPCLPAGVLPENVPKIEM